jgi:hypothetical protein
MKTHDRELARHLFVIATELLEDTHEVAVAGQSSSLTARKALKLAHRLRRTAHDLAAISGAIAVIADRERHG